MTRAQCDSLAPHLRAECLDAPICTKTFQQIDVHAVSACCVARLPCALGNAGSITKQHQFLPLLSCAHTAAAACVQQAARRIAGRTERRMDAALLGGREGVWQPCAPSCSGRNGFAAQLPCHNISRRQWIGAAQPSAFRSPFAAAPAPSPTVASSNPAPRADSQSACALSNQCGASPQATSGVCGRSKLRNEGQASV